MSAVLVVVGWVVIFAAGYAHLERSDGDVRLFLCLGVAAVGGTLVGCGFTS